MPDKVLDIGCGRNKYKGKEGDTVIGMDKIEYPGVDIIHDMDDLPLPFEDNDFDMVYMHHVLECSKRPKEVIEDIHRILKPDGIFKLIVPHFSNPKTYHFVHATHWGYTSLDGFQNPGLDFETKARFKIIKREFELITPFQIFKPLVERLPMFYEWRFAHLFPSSRIKFTLRAVK